STGQPGKIQLSESCYKLLKAGNQFEMINRGEVEVKGKGKMNTFWLEGKTGFDPSKLQAVLPELPK
ncbi:Adenylate cyclase type 1, partial [Globomyces sp. JEL0801]